MQSLSGLETADQILARLTLVDTSSHQSLSKARNGGSDISKSDTCRLLSPPPPPLTSPPLFPGPPEPPDNNTQILERSKGFVAGHYIYSHYTIQYWYDRGQKQIFRHGRWRRNNIKEITTTNHNKQQQIKTKQQQQQQQNNNKTKTKQIQTITFCCVCGSI